MTSKQSVACYAAAVLSILLPAAEVLHSQAAPASTFEVASIKPNHNADSLGGGALIQALPGRLVMTNFSVRTLVLFAYGVQGYQIAEEPSWISSDNYDVQATAAGNASVNQMEGPMLRALLEDRFKLATHRETRQLPVYDLTLLKGPLKLQATREGSCTPYAPDAPPPPAATPGTVVRFCGYPHTATQGLNHTLDGAGVSMEVLATNLSRLELHRSVLDKTGLSGAFDIHLNWASDALVGQAAAPADNVSSPSIYTALQEQLGLKLASARGPVEVLVIDHIEKPSGN